MSQVEVATPLRVMYYKGFRVQINKVYRFESEDTLVFALTLINDTSDTIYYLSNNFAGSRGRPGFYPIAFRSLRPDSGRSHRSRSKRQTPARF